MEETPKRISLCFNSKNQEDSEMRNEEEFQYDD